MDEKTRPTHTPGPWEWRGSPKNGGIYLQSRTHMLPTVMAFSKHGFANAFPLFAVDNLLVSAKDLGVKEVSYRDNIVSIDHPDARLMAAAPDLLAALKALTQAYADVLDSGDCGSWRSDEDTVYLAATYAILQAEGQS